MTIATGKILVITDRYPPDTHGGAEVSLHLTLRKLNQIGVPISVAALSDAHRSRVKEQVDGIDVYRIPFTNVWPPQLFSYRGRLRFLPSKKIRKAIRTALTDIGYLVANSTTPLSRRFKNLILHDRLRTPPIMDRDAVEMGPTVQILRQLIRELEPTIVHADNYRSITYAAAACTRQTKLSVLIRDNRFFCAERGQATNIAGAICTTCELGCVPSSKTAAYQRELMLDSMRFRKECLRRADKVLVTSEFLKAQIGRDFPCVAVVPNPIDMPDEVAKAQDGIEAAWPPEILCVGMVNQNKGQLILAQLLEFFRRELGDFRLCIAGRGQLLGAISRMAQGLEMSHNLFAPGFLSRAEIYKMYARATVVACPTVWPEPFGRAPLEAGLSRKPVVAFAVGGLTETIINGETGLLVPPHDIEQFGRAVVRIVKDPSLARRLGENAYRHVGQRYSLQQTTNGLLEAWTSLVSKDD
jgi:glycosyltransferase involved in cell wall biosynthesis